MIVFVIKKMGISGQDPISLASNLFKAANVKLKQ